MYTEVADVFILNGIAGGYFSKKWAPYIGIATNIARSIQVNKCVVLLTGIRHLRQVLSRRITPAEFESRVETCINTCKEHSPHDMIVLRSVITTDDPEIRECAKIVNNSLKAIAAKHNTALYANTASRFQNPKATIDGFHPKLSKTGLLARAIKAAASPSLPQRSRRPLQQNQLRGTEQIQPRRNRRVQGNRLDQAHTQPSNKESSQDLRLVCWSLTSLCHSDGHIETMPAREINPFTALTRIRSQFLRTQ